MRKASRKTITRLLTGAGVLVAILAAYGLSRPGFWQAETSLETVSLDPEGFTPAAGLTGTEESAEAMEPEVEASAASEVAGVAAQTEAPEFDIVRVQPDGSALVAGTALPGAEVTVYAGNKPLTQVEADVDGNFVAIFDAEPAEVPQALTLEAESGEGEAVTSEEVVMLLPEAGEDTGEAPEAATAADDAEEETQMAALSGDDVPEAEPTIAATAIVREDSVEVSRTVGPGADAAFELVSISYSASGEISLTGFGPAGSTVRAYVDNAASGEASVEQDGRWMIDLSEIEEGLYNLRVDQLEQDGRVAGRVETPFQRDFPTSPMPRPDHGPVVSADGTGLEITVQPGGTLWTLARVHYGAGVQYTRIFTANEGLIRDPDLIYPGQVLAIPGANRTN